MYEYLKYQRNLIKRIEKLFNGKYLFYIQVNDLSGLVPDRKNRYTVKFMISKKTNTFYGSDYVGLYQNESNDLKELGNDLIKYIKKSLKDGFFYGKSKNNLLPDTYLNLSELFICKDYIN